MKRSSPSYPKTELFWAVYNPFGTVLSLTVEILRREAIESAVNTMEREWKWLYADGYRAMRVSVIPVRP